MAAFFLVLALLGGAVIGDLVWENAAAGEVTVLGRTAAQLSPGLVAVRGGGARLCRRPCSLSPP